MVVLCHSRDMAENSRLRFPDWGILERDVRDGWFFENPLFFLVQAREWRIEGCEFTDYLIAGVYGYLESSARCVCSYDVSGVKKYR